MKYSFGPISVDADARTAETPGRSIHLTRKAFDLLLLLIEHRPNAVTKEQIYARLWPDTFVAESNLQTLVHEIRRAIDDTGTDRSWIRTVHGVGYSFTGTVAVGGFYAEARESEAALCARMLLARKRAPAPAPSAAAQRGDVCAETQFRECHRVDGDWRDLRDLPRGRISSCGLGTSGRTDASVFSAEAAASSPTAAP